MSTVSAHQQHSLDLFFKFDVDQKYLKEVAYLSGCQQRHHNKHKLSKNKRIKYLKTMKQKPELILILFL